MKRVQFAAWALVSAATLLASGVLARYAAAPTAKDIALRQTLPAPAAQKTLIVPVADVPASALVDSWGHARSEGRTHQGIDIMAPLGAPVLAATDGRLVRFYDSERGGVSIYQFDASERFVLYYAHLDARADVSEGQRVKQGEVIGYVGMSGNAPVPHLHFEIQRLTPERRWWEADALNPYPYLRSGRAP